MCDDLFDDDIRLSGAMAADDVSGRLWKKTSGELKKTGYREGRDAGQDAMLKEGFNQAFSASTQVMFHIAQLRGQVTGKLAYTSMKGDKRSRTTKMLEELLEMVQAYEKEMLTFSRQEFEGCSVDTNDDEKDKLLVSNGRFSKLCNLRQKFCEIITPT